MGPGGRRVIVSPRPSLRLPQCVEVHMTVLGAIFLLLLAVGYWLDRFDLLYSSRSVAYGAGYTDVNAKLPALTIMLVIALAMAVLLLINLRVRTWKLLAGALGLWLLALIAVDNIYPAIIQQFVVKPSELQLETPYIENNIAATRAAFGLDKFHEQEVPAVTSITREQIDENPNITNNIRPVGLPPSARYLRTIAVAALLLFAGWRGHRPLYAERRAKTGDARPPRIELGQPG